MYVVRDVLKSNISVIIHDIIFFQQPKNQRIKTFLSQISGIFFLIYKGGVMFYTSGRKKSNQSYFYIFILYIQFPLIDDDLTKD